jgi:hypothetical protein
MNRRIAILALALLCVATMLAVGRIVKTWTFEEMFAKADLVVIGQVASTTDTTESIELRDLEPSIQVVGVTTEFRTLLVLKGLNTIDRFKLHHYRLKSEEQRETLINGPDLARPKPHSRFLLFLLKESDGRYAPVTGQTDPASFSVLELRSAAN